MNKEWMGYVCLATGMIALFGGLSHGADGNHVGWIGSVVGLGLVVLSYRLFRSRGLAR